jgi:pimeloyl-ACP methyl ester carboxylesterase
MGSSQQQFTPELEISAIQALADFLTPPRQPLSAAESELLATATHQAIPFGEIDLQAFSWGNGAETVLLVHGWGGYGLQLSSFIEPLVRSGYRVLTFDAPAHGSTAGTQTNGLEMAEAIAMVARHRGPIAATIAHSLGATSTTMALSEGMLMGKVVYLGAVCWLANAAKVFAKRSRLSVDVESAFLQLFEAKFGRDLWHRFSIEQTAKNLTVPALLFHDTRDREAAIIESQTISQIWKGARLIETSGLGHRRILYDEAVVRAAIEFL